MVQYSYLEPASVLPGDSGDMDEEAAKEWEHTLLQDTMDKELNELNRRLEQKEVRQTLDCIWTYHAGITK